MNALNKLSRFLPVFVIVFTAFLFVGCGKIPQDPPTLHEFDLNVEHAEKRITVNLNASKPLEYSKDNGTSWQIEKIFTNLTVGETYQIVVRYAETDEFDASPASNAISITIKAESTEQTLTSNDFTVETSTSNRSLRVTSALSGIEYSINNGSTWTSNGYWSSLTPGRYNVIARYKETDTTMASAPCEPFEVIVKGEYGMPYVNKDNINCTDTTITITTAPNSQAMEFAISEGSRSTNLDTLVWQEEKVFTGLKPDTTYYIYVRYKASEFFIATPSRYYYDTYVTTEKTQREAPTLTLDDISVDVETGVITVNKSGVGLRFNYTIKGQTNNVWVKENTYDNAWGKTYLITIQYSDEGGYAGTAPSQTVEVAVPYKQYKNVVWNTDNISLDLANKTITCTAPTGEDFDAQSLCFFIGTNTENMRPFDQYKGGSDTVFANALFGTTYYLYAKIAFNYPYAQWNSQVVEVNFPRMQHSEITLSSAENGNVVVNQENATVTVNVSLTSGETGEISYYLDNEKQSSNSFAVTRGVDHTVYIKIAQDDTYAEFTSNTLTINVDKLDRTDTFTTSNISISQKTITVTGFEENAMYKFGDNDWTTENTYTVAKFNTTLDVSVKYEADDTYNAYTQTLSVTVPQANLTQPVINVETDVKIEGNTLTITPDATQYSSLGIDNVEFEYSFESNSNWGDSNTYTITKRGFTLTICVITKTTDEYTNDGSITWAYYKLDKLTREYTFTAEDIAVSVDEEKATATLNATAQERIGNATVQLCPKNNQDEYPTSNYNATATLASGSDAVYGKNYYVKVKVLGDNMYADYYFDTELTVFVQKLTRTGDFLLNVDKTVKDESESKKPIVYFTYSTKIGDYNTYESSGLHIEQVYIQIPNETGTPDTVTATNQTTTIDSTKYYLQYEFTNENPRGKTYTYYYTIKETNKFEAYTSQNYEITVDKHKPTSFITGMKLTDTSSETAGFNESTKIYTFKCKIANDTETGNYTFTLDSTEYRWWSDNHIEVYINNEKITRNELSYDKDPVTITYALDNPPVIKFVYTYSTENDYYCKVIQEYQLGKGISPQPTRYE